MAKSKLPKWSIPRVQGYLDHMMQVLPENVNPFSVHEWVAKNGMLSGSKADKVMRWGAIRDYLTANYNVYFPVETQNYKDLLDTLKEMKEKEKSNV